MRKLRSRLAIWCAKLSYRLIRLFRLGDGAALPGAIAKGIDPNILTELAGMVSGKILAVLGTNGKTTVNSILYQALRQQGEQVVSNRTGANMENGVITAFVLRTGRGGRLRADYACIEVDENAAKTVLPKLSPDGILVTNLFRDQLDRYGEVDVVYERLREAISLVPKAVLIVNCDDALLGAMLSQCPNPGVTFGVEEVFFDEMVRPKVREGMFCRFCGQKLEYSLVHYGQLGLYHCPGCGFERPDPDYRASQIRIEGEESFMELDGKRLRLPASAPYQVYNVLGAYGALKAVGAPTDLFGGTVEDFDFENHREARYCINGGQVQIYLAKNPVGFQQKLSLLCRDKRQKDILILINDTAQDGRDVSWLWDVEFRYLMKAHPASVTVGGRRRYDMGLRLKYEDIPCTVTEDIQGTIQELTGSGTKNLYILLNYSMLYPMNRLLGRMQEAQEKEGRL